MADPMQPPNCSKIKQQVEDLRRRSSLVKLLPIPAPAKDAIVLLVELLGELVEQVNRLEAQLEVQGGVIDQLIEERHEQTDRTL